MVLTPSGVVEIPVEGQVDESEGMQPSMPSFAPEQEQSSRRGAVPPLHNFLLADAFQKLICLTSGPHLQNVAGSLVDVFIGCHGID